MSTKHRRQRQERTAEEQLAKAISRTFDTLYDLQRGPWSPGPWWPADHPKYRSEPSPSRLTR